MGLFDIFKEKLNWTLDELISLFALGISIGAADGKLEGDEIKTLLMIILKLPSSEKVPPLEDLTKAALELDNAIVFKTLSNMHLKKRKIVIDVLRKVMYSDGEVDIAETEFLMRVGTAINVDLH